MEHDKELLESFIEEITSLNQEILLVLKALTEDINQPSEFLKFSNIIDRIYGTALTLGFKDLGNYCGELKAITRMTGNAEVPRAMPPVMKLMMNYTTHFKLLKESVENPKRVHQFNEAIKIDLKKIENLHKDVFAYTKGDASKIKS